jgi:hypothetical protein
VPCVAESARHALRHSELVEEPLVVSPSEAEG